MLDFVYDYISVFCSDNRVVSSDQNMMFAAIGQEQDISSTMVLNMLSYLRTKLR